MVEYQTFEEQKRYEKKILENDTGKGTIYNGQYYTLDYQPARRSYSRDLKCIGVELIIRRKSDKNAHDFNSVIVHFREEPLGFFGNLIASDEEKKLKGMQFKDRLDYWIKKQSELLQAQEKHMAALDEQANKVVACQIKIDQTMSEFKKGA